MKKASFIALISACVFLIICCNSKKKVTDPGTKEPDFTIQVIPQAQWVTAGESTEYQIKLTSVNGFSAPCTLSIDGFPEGDSAVFDSKVLVPTDSSRLTIYTDLSTPRETYELVITGKNGKANHSDTGTLVVPSVTDYYPLAIGNSWTYAWLDSSGQSWWTFTLTIIDTMTINGNFGYLFDDISFLYVKGDGIFSKAGEIVLLGPLVIGQSWIAQSWNYELIEFGAVTLTDGTEYQNCIKLKKTDPDYPQAWEYEWWAKDVGQVKWDTYAYGQYQGGRELVSFIHY